MKRQNYDRMCYRIWIFRLVLAVLFLTAGGTAGQAYDYYLMDFNATYNTYGSALDTCKLCHPGYPISNARNSFGSDYARADVGNHTFNPALETADSDGDGPNNLEEITARTFPGDPASTPPPGPTLASLSVDGPSSVNEGDTEAYLASATWSNGTTTTEPAAWSVAPGTVASIDSAGVLTAMEVSSDQPATVSATFNGMTATLPVTIVNVPAGIPPLPADAIRLTPQDGAADVPVTAVVVASLTGGGDIASVVNDSTFSLTDSGTVVAGSIGYNDSHTEAIFTPLEKLTHGTLYTATLVPGDGTVQPVLETSVCATFTTIAQTPDSDGDGVEDAEDDHPHDNGKATPRCVRGMGKFLVNLFGNAGIALAGAEGISDMYPQFQRHGKPFGFSFPDGLLRYRLKNAPPGGSMQVSIRFPSGIPHGSRVFQVGRTGFREWRNAVVTGDSVSVTLTDGGEGDADGVVNGEIEDPIGVAVPDSTPGTGVGSGSPSAAGGCSTVGPGTGGTGALLFVWLVALAWIALRILRRWAGAER